MPTSSILLACLAVLFVVGIAAWAIRRRTGAFFPAWPLRYELRERLVPAAPGDALVIRRESPITGPDPPQCRDVLHRLYAVAFDGAHLDEAAVSPGPGHAEVTAGAASILAKIETQPRYTPRRPLLLPQLMRTVNDPDTSARTIAAILAQDPALSGNLLRIASSALYRVQSGPVESIERAVAMVGTDGIRQIIAAALVQPVISASGSVFGRFPAIIWEHTLLSAAAAADHAQRVEHDDAFAAQLVGLLHGLGSIIVVQVVRDQYAKRPELVPDAVVATALLDARAAPTARRIAASWELPDRIGDALGDQQRAGAPGKLSALGRSLRFGRSAGALALLCQHGRMQEAEALLTLAGIETRVDATAGIWTRMRRSVDEGVSTSRGREPAP